MDFSLRLVLTSQLFHERRLRLPRPRTYFRFEMMVASDGKLQAALHSLPYIDRSKCQDRSQSLGTDTMKALVRGLCLLGPLSALEPGPSILLK
jgi:hypothetical protein